MNNSRISTVKVGHFAIQYDEAKFEVCAKRSRNTCNFYKILSRAVSRRRPSFPAEKLARQWRGGLRPSPPYILTRRGILARNYVGVRRLYLSDSKFTSAIVVGNVPSIYPVTFIPAMPRRRSPFRRVTPLPTQYSSTPLSTPRQVTTRSRMRSPGIRLSLFAGIDQEGRWTARRNRSPDINRIGHFERSVSPQTEILWERQGDSIKWLYSGKINQAAVTVKSRR